MNAAPQARAEVVLAIRLRALGDVVLTTPALRALARGHGGAALHVVTDPRYVPLVEGLPHVAKVWALPRTHAGTWSVVRALRALPVRVAVDFFGNPRSAVVATRCGARRSFGYALRGRAYDVAVPREQRPGPDRREHAAATHVRLAEAAGGLADGLEAVLPLSEATRAAALALLRAAGVDAPGRAVGLVVAGTWPTKTWPVAHAAVLARRLVAAGRAPLLLAGPGEDDVTHRFQALAPGVKILPACDVATMVGVLAQLGGVVGTDSGPRHVAAAFGVPTFAWFGPTHPDTWNPPGVRHGFWRSTLPCRACDRTRCPHWNCLPSLSGEEASALVLAHLERHGR